LITAAEQEEHLESRVLKMKEPLTPKQLQSLLEVSDAVSVKTILEEMHNWADLTKKVSTYKTAKTWLERRKTNPIGKQPEQPTKSSYDRKFKGYE
jgi:chromosome segregation and condensation protein ScpB